MRRKLRTRRGRLRYTLRMETVEPVFGQIKQGRGFRQFLLRGLDKVNGEWSLICTGHNLLKLFRNGRLSISPAPRILLTLMNNALPQLQSQPIPKPQTHC